MGQQRFRTDSGRDLGGGGIAHRSGVEIREEDGCIVIKPVIPPSYDLDALLDRMTPETFPEGVDFGAPAGKEAW